LEAALRGRRPFHGYRIIERCARRDENGTSSYLAHKDELSGKFIIRDSRLSSTEKTERIKEISAILRRYPQSKLLAVSDQHCYTFEPATDTVEPQEKPEVSVFEQAQKSSPPSELSEEAERMCDVEVKRQTGVSENQLRERRENEVQSVADQGANAEEVRDHLLSRAQQAEIVREETEEIPQKVLPGIQPETAPLRLDQRPPSRQMTIRKTGGARSIPVNFTLTYPWWQAHNKLVITGVAVLVGVLSVLTLSTQRWLGALFGAGNTPPVLELIEISPSSLMAGESATLSAHASDPDGDAVTYEWQTTAGQIVGTGSQVTLDTSGIFVASGPIRVRVNLTINDGRGGTKSVYQIISVAAPGSLTDTVDDRCGRTATNQLVPRANHPPTLERLDAGSRKVALGERVSLAVKASDPDRDQLTYTWSTTAGAIEGSGETVTLNTSSVNLDPESTQAMIHVTVAVNDEHGGLVRKTIPITVTNPLNFLTFRVRHHHRGSPPWWCDGALKVYDDKIIFQSSVEGDIEFPIDRTKVEVKKRALPNWLQEAGRLDTFQINFKEGRNYSFAYIGAEGQQIDPDPIVNIINARMR
jgi:hypothetical protein